MNPKNNLVRFEFMECLVRVVKDKYVRSGLCETISEGMEKMLKENLIPNCINLNP